MEMGYHFFFLFLVDNELPLELFCERVVTEKSTDQFFAEYCFSRKIFSAFERDSRHNGIIPGLDFNPRLSLSIAALARPSRDIFLDCNFLYTSLCTVCIDYEGIIIIDIT